MTFNHDQNKFPSIDFIVTINGKVGLIEGENFEYNFIGEVSDFKSHYNADVSDYVKKICDAIKDAVVKHGVKENGIQ